jgi:hypothetical protein
VLQACQCAQKTAVEILGYARWQGWRIDVPRFYRNIALDIHNAILCNRIDPEIAQYNYMQDYSHLTPILPVYLFPWWCTVPPACPYKTHIEAYRAQVRFECFQ